MAEDFYLSRKTYKENSKIGFPVNKCRQTLGEPFPGAEALARNATKPFESASAFGLVMLQFPQSTGE